MSLARATSPERPASTRERFLAAGARVFVREGYVGTSMALVAKDAGLSRAALYKHFNNKGALFKSVAEMLHEVSAAASADLAANALLRDESGTDLIVGFMAARRQRFRELLNSSTHASELMEESSRRCGPLIRRYGERFKAALITFIETVANAGRLSLRDDISPAVLADMLLAAEAGLKSGSAVFLSPGFEVAFRRMAQTLLAGACKPNPPGRNDDPSRSSPRQHDF